MSDKKRQKVVIEGCVIDHFTYLTKDNKTIYYCMIYSHDLRITYRVAVPEEIYNGIDTGVDVSILGTIFNYNGVNYYDFISLMDN